MAEASAPLLEPQVSQPPAAAQAPAVPAGTPVTAASVPPSTAEAASGTPGVGVPAREEGQGSGSSGSGSEYTSGDSSEDEDGEGDADPWNSAVALLLARESRGAQISVPVAKLNPFLICVLCDGYFRECTTIKECGHAFCKDCLYNFFYYGHTRCPVCSIPLGVTPEKHTAPDPVKQGIVKKLFPQFEKEEEEEELQEANAAAGVDDTAPSGTPTLKRSRTGGSASLPPAEKRRRLAMTQALAKDLSYVCFRLVPAELDEGTLAGDLRFSSLPPLEKPCLCTLGALKLSNLRRYVSRKLDMPEEHVALLCNGALLVGKDHSMEFIWRTKWHNPRQDMVLQYSRLA